MEDQHTTDPEIARLNAEHPLQPGVKFGLFDTQDNVWIGTKRGPLLYEDKEINGIPLAGSLMARYCAEMYDTMMRQRPKRTISKVFDEKGPLVMRDEVIPFITVEQAITLREKGLVI